MANGQDLVYVENWNGTFDKTTVSNGQLRLVAQPPTFTRSSVAYLSDGTQVAANTPRLEAGKFGNAIMIEEGTTNLVSNPSFETDSDSNGMADNWYVWIRGDGDSSRTHNNYRVLSLFGSGYAQHVEITATSNTNPSALSQNNIAVSPNTTYTFSFYGRASVVNKVGFSIQWRDSSGVLIKEDSTTQKLGTTVSRVSFTATAPSNASTVWLVIYGINTVGEWFEVDCVQLEAKPYATSFIDGTRAAEPLTIPTAGVLNKDEGTIDCWVYVNNLIKDTTVNRYIWATTTNAGSPYNNTLALVHRNTGTWRLWIVDNSAYPQAVDIADTLGVGWHYFSCRWSQTEASLFIDGVKKGSVTNPSLPSNIANTLYVGSWNGSSGNPNTLIDDLRISNRARTDEEIAQAYASGQPLPVDEWTTYKLGFDNNLDFNVYGTYITNPIDISSVGRIKSTAIGWNGTNTRVSMSISKNNGVTWSSWLDVTNGGNLPNIVNNSSASGVQIKFMITLIKNSSVNPNFSNFIIEIYTLTIEEAVHYQKIRNLYIKIDLLDKNDIKIGELNGLALDGSVDINSTQAIRRTCDVTFYLSDNLLPSSTSEIWLDKRFRLWVGLKDLLTDDIIYFNLGIFVVGDPQIDISINQRTIEIKGYDKMCLLDGTIGGQLSNIVNIPINTSITQAIRSTMQQLAGENKLLIDNMKDSNGNDIVTPYTIEEDVTKTLYDVINELVSLYMYYEAFYDVNGYFVFQKRKDLYNDPIIWDFTNYDFRVTSSCQLSFSNVKNYITVYGATLSDGSQPSYTLSVSNALYPDFPYTIEKIGQRNLTISENNYFNSAQCQSRAEYEAWLHTNFNDKITITCAPIYMLDVNRLIYLDYPQDGISGKYTISEINIPLKYDGTMSITAYKVYEQTNQFT